MLASAQVAWASKLYYVYSDIWHKIIKMQYVQAFTSEKALAWVSYCLLTTKID